MRVIGSHFEGRGGLSERVREQLGLTGWNLVRQADRYLRKEALELLLPASS